VASTLYKYLKYSRGRERKINGNVKVFTKDEFHFADTRFFEQDDAPKETMLSTITSYGKRWHEKCPSSTIGRHSHTSAQEGRKQTRRHTLFYQASG